MYKVYDIDEIDINNIKIDNVSKVFTYNGNILYVTCKTTLLENNLNILIDNCEFLEFVNNIDVMIIRKLINKDKSVENKYISAIRRSALSESEFLRVKLDNTLYFNNSKVKIHDFINTYQSDILKIKPVFQLTYKQNNDHKWTEWELIQCIVLDVDVDDDTSTFVMPNKCLLETYDDIDEFN